MFSPGKKGDESGLYRDNPGAQTSVSPGIVYWFFITLFVMIFSVAVSSYSNVP